MPIEIVWNAPFDLKIMHNILYYEISERLYFVRNIKIRV